MKLWLLGLTGTLVAACVSALVGAKTSTPPTPLKDYGPAPELTNTNWLNTDSPLRLADLRGKVTLIDMWTYG